MGKRKSSAPVKAKIRPKLDTMFDCLFCNYEQSVTVKLDKKEALGHLKCTKCPKKFTTKLAELDVGIDIYFKWIDACEAANQEIVETDDRPRRDPSPPSRTRNSISKVVKVSRTSQPKKRVSEVAPKDGYLSENDDGYSSGSLPDLDDLHAPPSPPSPPPPKRRLRRDRTQEADANDESSRYSPPAPAREGRRGMALTEDEDEDEDAKDAK